MHRNPLAISIRFAVIIALMIGLTFVFSACSDDDDDNDDASPVVDDDITDDDQSIDDDGAPDDDLMPDDDAIDDDANDDDFIDDDADYSKEPLAVLDCDPMFADVGQNVSFDGTGSSDPNDSELTFHLSFGDGNSVDNATATHQYNTAGVFEAILSITNEEGFLDNTRCTIMVGDFPVEVGNLDTIEYRENYYDSSIWEPGDKPKDGGMVWGFFVSPIDAEPDTILINDEVYEPQADSFDWCEVIPAVLQAGQPAMLRCMSYTNRFNPGKSVKLEVLDGDTSLWSKTATLINPKLSPSYITSNVAQDELLVHVRNDSQATQTITGLAIDGSDVSNWIVVENPELEPGETGIIRVLQPDGVVLYDWRFYSVFGSDGKSDYSETRGLRLHLPIFPMSDWNSGSALDNLENLQRHLDMGINAFIYSPSESQPPATILDWAETYDFYVWTHRGNIFDPPDQYFLDFIAEYGDSERILTNAVAGEPDIGGEDPHQVLDEVQKHREAWGDEKPLWVYNACSYKFATFAPLADIGGMDHYCVWAPQCNYNFPPFYWDRIENLGIYSDIIKRSSEPNRTWNWTQGLFNTMRIEEFQLRCTTGDEIRAQFYMVLSRGSKGLLWFFWKTDWADNCPAASSMAMEEMAHELEIIKDTLLEGEYSFNGSIAQVEIPEGENPIDVSVTMAPNNMVVFLNNLNYDLNLIGPFQWYERENVVVDFTPPDFFEPAEFLLVDDTDLIELSWEKVGPNHWRFIVPSLQVAEAILVVPEP